MGLATRDMRDIPKPFPIDLVDVLRGSREGPHAAGPDKSGHRSARETQIWCRDKLVQARTRCPPCLRDLLRPMQKLRGLASYSCDSRTPLSIRLNRDTGGVHAGS